MMSFAKTLLVIVASVLVLNQVRAIVLNADDQQSIRSAAAAAVHGLQQIYNGNTTGVLGKFPYPPYYWWESGAAWGGMVNYWHYTGDASYNNVTYNALVSQIGPASDFVMLSEAFDEGNDDQAFWVLAAMSAAEYDFQRPPPPYACWEELCINAFNDYVRRWNASTCGGGLQWQFHPENAGFYYKNAISNGAFFQLSARFLRMTGNRTYLDWANRVYDWSIEIGLVDNRYNVFDGTDDNINCTDINHEQWTYNIAMYLYGSAVMQNYTNGSAIWAQRTSGFLEATATFFSPFLNSTNIMFEAECELSSTCNVDQVSMKAYLARWLAGTSILAPFTAGRVGTLLRASALGAAAACNAGLHGNTCGNKWYIGGSDGTSGLGQQLSAVEIMYALLANETSPPMTLSNVRIQNEPASVTSLRPLPAPPRSTAIPLYGVHNEASMVSGVLFAFFSTFALAVILAIVM